MNALPRIPGHLTVVRGKRLFRVHDDSMAPTIAIGDLVEVDLSQTAVEDDSIYVIRVDGQPRLGRLRRINGGLGIVADNPRNHNCWVPPEELNRIVVMGLATAIWSPA